jgi:hypothetical protein
MSTATRQAVTHIWELQWFESMYIQQEKHDTHMNWHICAHDKSYASTFTADPIELGGSYCSREKGPLSRSTTCRLTDPWVPTSFLSSNSHWSSRWKPIIYWRTWYIDLLDPYLQRVISTFNTCSREQSIDP